MPAGVCAHFIMGHAQCRFRFLEALFNRPPHTTQPHEQAQWRARRSVAEVVSRRRTRPQGALDHQPPSPVGEPILAERHPFAGKRIRDRAFGAFRDRSTIPARGCEALRQNLHRDGGLRRRGDHAFGTYLSFVPLGVFRGQRSLEPTTRLGGNGHQRRPSDTAIDGGKEVRTIPIEAIGHNILEGESTLAPDGL